jgi:hypothetical protein
MPVHLTESFNTMSTWTADPPKVNAAERSFMLPVNFTMAIINYLPIRAICGPVCSTVILNLIPKTSQEML